MSASLAVTIFCLLAILVLALLQYLGPRKSRTIDEAAQHHVDPRPLSERETAIVRSEVVKLQKRKARQRKAARRHSK